MHLELNTTGIDQNTALGQNTMYTNGSNGDFNTAVGRQALYVKYNSRQ